VIWRAAAADEAPHQSSGACCLKLAVSALTNRLQKESGDYFTQLGY
jgi:hypothetical protein